MEVLPITLGRATSAGQPSANSSASATNTTTAKKSSLRVTLPLTRPPSTSSAHSPDSPHPEDVVTPDDVGEVMARGNACFLAIQTAAEVRIYPSVSFGFSVNLVALLPAVWRVGKVRDLLSDYNFPPSHLLSGGLNNCWDRRFSLIVSAFNAGVGSSAHSSHMLRLFIHFGFDCPYFMSGRCVGSSTPNSYATIV